MKRALLATCIALAGLVGTATVYAQTSGALGKPLPSPDMAKGTLTVKVVAGSQSNPVIGTDVTLIVNGATRVARTDAGGRAHFKDLPPDARLQAKVVDEDKKEVASDEFALPPDTGARVMLSTRPWNPNASAGPAMAGGAMPNPRAMTGEPRPDGVDPPGQITVRLSYDDFKDAPPVDVPVALVGYAHDGKVVTKVEKSDKEGRVKFTGLDRTGATSYFAMTQLPRNNVTDRVTSTPVVLDPRAGVRMILSSHKRTSTLEPIDDLSKLERQDGAPAPGKVRVTLEGGPDPSATVTLIDAEQRIAIARGNQATSAPDPTEVQVQANFDDQPDIPAGTLRIYVHGGSTSDAPMSGVKARLVVASSPDKTVANELVTDASGTLELKAMTPEPVVAVLVVNGKEMSSKPLDLTKTGGKLDLAARWPAEGKPEVMFDLVPRPGQVVYVETTMHGQVYRTLPFQPLPERGTRVTLFIFPRVLFSFSLTSRIDDEYLAVNGKFEVSNNSWMPYVGGPDGVILPLPKGFVGGLVAEKDQGDVALTPGEGFRIVRPIAPGQRTFHGAFSLPNDDGEVVWNWDLPLGAFNSGMEILQVPGMHVQTPPNVRGETATIPQGTYFVLPQISILPKQSMVMTLTGLPRPPAWRVWLPRFIGLAVVLLMIGGVVFALNRSKADAATSAERDARRQKLLDELVEIEKYDKTSKTEKRREQLTAELEKLWDDAA